jgi:hypothetical protein
VRRGGSATVGDAGQRCPHVFDGRSPETVRQGCQHLAGRRFEVAASVLRAEGIQPGGEQRLVVVSAGRAIGDGWHQGGWVVLHSAISDSGKSAQKVF